MSKIIYQPKGKAREYSPWAANLYNGCSNLCDYCYNRTGVAYKVLGKDVPTLKESLKSPREDFSDTANAYSIFIREIGKYREQIKKDGKGLFFNFVSDPCLKETYKLNLACMRLAVVCRVDCVMLTKKADWLTYPQWQKVLNDDMFISRIKVGFTLTGRDDLEPNASTNAERIEAMRELKTKRVKTWASIEPIISLEDSKRMIMESLPYCDEYKIGILSGKKTYTPKETKAFYDEMCEVLKDKKVYWKESILEYIKK